MNDYDILTSLTSIQSLLEQALSQIKTLQDEIPDSQLLDETKHRPSLSEMLRCSRHFTEYAISTVKDCGRRYE